MRSRAPSRRHDPQQTTTIVEDHAAHFAHAVHAEQHELAGRLHEMHPAVKFLFVSGDPKARDLVKDGAFLAKPFSKQQLIDSVGSILLGAV